MKLRFDNLRYDVKYVTLYSNSTWERTVTSHAQVLIKPIMLEVRSVYEKKGV